MIRVEYPWVRTTDKNSLRKCHSTKVSPKKPLNKSKGYRKMHPLKDKKTISCFYQYISSTITVNIRLSNCFTKQRPGLRYEASHQSKPT